LTKLFPLSETVASEEAVFYHLRCNPSCKSSIRLSWLSVWYLFVSFRSIRYLYLGRRLL